MSITILRANALALPLADESVDLVVTSPPYFGLRSYQDGGEHYEGQIGSEATPAEFIDALIAATREMARVLKPSGSIWVNLGDKYVSRQSFYDQTNGGSWAKIHKHTGDDRQNGEKVPDARGEKSRSNYLTEQTGIRNKSLMGIPWRYAIRCIDDLGLILRAEVIWSKPNGLPESVTDRVRRSHEQWFHFTKEPRYYSAVDEIREPHKSEPGREGVGALGGQKTLRPVGTNSGSYNALGALPGSVWTVATEPLRVPDHLGINHFAAFPTEWPRRIITGWSPRDVCTACGEGRRPVANVEQTARRPIGLAQMHTAMDARADKGTKSNIGHVISSRTITGYACACPDTSAPATPGVVLDPFGGTGTTALVADVLGRDGITVDLSADYCRLAQWRTTDPKQRAKAARVEAVEPVSDDQPDLFEVTA